MDMESYGKAFNAAVAAELRAERAARRYTVEELARNAGLVKLTLLRYLNAQRDIPMPALADICRALNIEASDILNRAAVRLKREQ